MNDSPSDLNVIGDAEGWADNAEGLNEPNEVGVAEGLVDNAEGN